MSALVLHEWLSTDSPRTRRQAKLSRLYFACRSFMQSPLAVTGLALTIVFLFVAVAAPLLATHDPAFQDLSSRLQPPSAAHWLGTDELGRDIYSRILYGSRITLGIVVAVILTAAPVGMLVGCSAGYLGGWTDQVLMRVTDIFLAFPRLILALAFVAAMGPGIMSGIIAIALTAWPVYARVARAETLSIRKSDFISSALLQGASSWRIIRKHVAPFCVTSITVRATLDISTIILTAAGLGFLGLGAQPPSPEWGAMVSSGRRFIFEQWWIATMPGIAIFLAALGSNLLGDGLRDVLDPKAA